MRAAFLLVFLLVPIIEIFLFVEVGSRIGGGWTFLLTLATAFIGLTAMRRQGLATLAGAQQAQIEGRPPVTEVAHGILILLAGALLFIPGFLTDTFGGFLLWPFGRSFLLGTTLVLVVPALFAGVRANPQAPPFEQDPQQPARAPEHDGKTIEGDFTINDD